MDSVRGIVAVLEVFVTSLHFHDILWEVFLYPDEQFKVSLKISVMSNVYTSNAYRNTENVN